MKKQNIIQILPIVICSIVLIWTWTLVINGSVLAVMKHWLGLACFIINIVCYLFQFKIGLVFTAIFLLLATFNLVAIFPDVVSSSVFIRLGKKELETPSIQGRSLLLLLLYMIVNGNYFIQLYIGRKMKNKER